MQCKRLLTKSFQDECFWILRLFECIYVQTFSAHVPTFQQTFTENLFKFLYKILILKFKIIFRKFFLKDRKWYLLI